MRTGTWLRPDCVIRAVKWIEGAKKLVASLAGGETMRKPDREGVVLGLSPSGFHELAYTDWGPLDDKRPVICVHGLTRQGRDFDHLAERLVAAGRRVICPDL